MLLCFVGVLFSNLPNNKIFSFLDIGELVSRALHEALYAGVLMFFGLFNSFVYFSEMLRSESECVSHFRSAMLRDLLANLLVKLIVENFGCI